VGTGRYAVDFGFDYEGLTVCPKVAVATTVGALSVRVQSGSEGDLSGDCVFNVESFWVPEGGPVMYADDDFTIAQLDGTSRLTLP